MDKEGSLYARKIITEYPVGSHVLDLGGGSGADAKLFLKKGFRVTLIDISDYVLGVVAKWATDNGYNLTIKRITLGEEDLVLDEKVDVVYSRMALHYFDFKNNN